MRHAGQPPSAGVWAAVALAALGAAGLYAVVLVLLRSPVALWVPGADTVFRVALVVHVQLAFVFWMLAYAASRWALPVQSAALAWVGGGGGVLVAVSPWWSPTTSPETLLVNYLPATVDAPFIVGGVVLLGAISVAALAFLVQPARQRRGHDPSGWLQAAALAFVVALVVFGLPDGRGWAPRAWAAGHLLQFCYAALAVEGVWQLLGRPAVAWQRGAAAGWVGTLLLAVLWSTVASDPSAAFYTRLMQWWLWPVPLGVIGVLWFASARQGAGGIAERSIVASILALFVTGCVLGGLIRTDSLLVPAHYHAVLGAITALGLARLSAGGRPSGAVAVRALRWIRIYVAGKFVLVAGLIMLALSGARRKEPLASLLEGDGWGLPGAVAVVVGGGLAVVSVLGLLGVHFVRHRPSREIASGEVEHG